MSAVLTEFRKRVVTEFRKPVMTMVEASWRDTDGISRTIAARMEDKSPGGVCVRIKTRLAVGSELRIQWRHDHFSGTVRYCRSDGMEFLAGIQRHASENALPNLAGSADIPEQKTSRSNDPLIPANETPANRVPATNSPPVETESPPSRQQSMTKLVPTIEQNAERTPSLSVETSTAMAATGIGHEADDYEIEGHEIDDKDSRRSRAPDFDALAPADARHELQPGLDPEPRVELQIKQPPTQAGERRKRMRDKWLELPWQKKQKRPSEGGQGDGEGGGNDNDYGKSEKENLMPDSIHPTQKAPGRSAREVPAFQVDLPPMEDIYRAAGIMSPRRGYSINKVVDMLHSEHIRELPKEMKRAAVLMALDASGTPVDQVQKDAKARQDALDAHEAQQTKEIEAEWTRKAEEITQIQAELESLKAHYMARISQNMEGVAREKATFNSWLTLKQQECQSMAEAVELCLKSPGSEPAVAPPLEVGIELVKTKTV
jgi:hypothetical protein